MGVEVIGVLAVGPSASREHASRMGEETATSLRQGVLRDKGRRN
jgi:hypothetical protein